MSTMTTGTRTRPALPGLDHADEDAIHVTCCDEDIAMCGLDVTDHAVIETDDDSKDCRVCRVAADNDLPCPVPGCGR